MVDALQQIARDIEYPEQSEALEVAYLGNQVGRCIILIILR